MNDDGECGGVVAPDLDILRDVSVHLLDFESLSGEPIAVGANRKILSEDKFLGIGIVFTDVLSQNFLSICLEIGATGRWLIFGFLEGSGGPVRFLFGLVSSSS